MGSAMPTRRQAGRWCLCVCTCGQDIFRPDKTSLKSGFFCAYNLQPGTCSCSRLLFVETRDSVMTMSDISGWCQGHISRGFPILGAVPDVSRVFQW